MTCLFSTVLLVELGILGNKVQQKGLSSVKVPRVLIHPTGRFRVLPYFLCREDPLRQSCGRTWLHKAALELVGRKDNEWLAETVAWKTCTS